MPFLLIDVSISFRWYILSNTTSIVSSRGTFENKDFTSHDIMLNPWGTFTCRIFFYEILCTLDCVLRLTQRVQKFC